MKINQPTFLLLFLFFISQVNAQEFKLGKVSIAELEEKTHTKDSAAVAAILFKIGETKFEYSESVGFEVVTTIKTKIKIYKKEGYNWANQEVRYYLGNTFNENVYFKDVFTYNLVNGKIEKTKLKSDGEFTEKINKYWGQKKITMPNVKEGSIIEFQYSIKSGYIVSLRDWYFQYPIPVNFSEYTTYIPEYFDYSKNQKGFALIQTVIEKLDRKINYASTIDYKDGSKPIRSNEELNFTETKTIYSVKDLQAIKEEAFVNNIDNYTSSVSHELSTTKFPNSIIKYYSSNWESVAKTIYEYDDFGPELNKTGYFEDDINKIMAVLNTPKEKIETIFNFVKTAVKWNENYGYSCNAGVKTAYKNKTGNVAEINLMLTAMLNYVGITANPVLVSTRSNGIALFPSRNAFNYVIVAAETPEGVILLDATEKYSVPNVLPLRDLNWFGRLIRKDGTSTQIDLMPKTLSKEIINMNVDLNSDGSVNGKLRQQLTNHEALEFRKANLSINKEDYLEKIETYNNIEISDYISENNLDLSKPILQSYSFKDSKSMEIINDKMYISPLLFLTPKKNPFKQEKREYPIDFGYPKEVKHNINIKIPDGYVVESLPKAINISTGENIGTFKYLIANIENNIQIVITTDINSAIVTPDFYEVLKYFFQQMIDKQNEKIVLKKI